MIYNVESFRLNVACVSSHRIKKVLHVWLLAASQIQVVTRVFALIQAFAQKNSIAWLLWLLDVIKNLMFQQWDTDCWLHHWIFKSKIKIFKNVLLNDAWSLTWVSNLTGSIVGKVLEKNHNICTFAWSFKQWFELLPHHYIFLPEWQWFLKFGVWPEF